MKKIKITRNYIMPMKVGRVHGYLQHEVVDALDLSENGWARIETHEGIGFLPPSIFEVIEEPKERTYTEVEVKALQDDLEHYKKVYASSREVNKQFETRIQSVRDEWEKKLWEAESSAEDKYEELERSHAEQIKAIRQEWEGIHQRDMRINTDLMSRNNAKQRKLDLLAPEIESIDQSIRLVVPEDEEGTLAEHVQRVCEIVLGLQDLKQRGAKAREAIDSIIGRARKEGNPIFTETEHPEDVYARQHQEYKPRHVRGIR